MRAARPSRSPITISANKGGSGNSTDGGTGDDVICGGCSAEHGGGAASMLLVGLGLILARRRR